MTSSIGFYGAFFVNGALKGQWHEMFGEAPSTFPYIAIDPSTEKAYTINYELTYEVHPSPDGLRNFYYQDKG